MNYVLGVRNLLAVYQYGPGTSLKQWVDITLSGGTDCSSSSCVYGAGWNFGERSTLPPMAARIIEILVDTIDLVAKTATRRNVADSVVVSTNDGFNCPTLVPFATCGDKNTVEIARTPIP